MRPYQEPPMDEGPLEEEGIKIGVEAHWIEGIVMIEVNLKEENSLMEMEDPLIEMENPLMMDGPSDGGGPPDDRGPPRNGWNPRHPERWGPPGPPGPPGPVRPAIVQQAQVTLDMTALDNTFGTVGPVYVPIG